MGARQHRLGGPAVTANGYSVNRNEWVWSCIKGWVDEGTVELPSDPSSSQAGEGAQQPSADPTASAPAGPRRASPKRRCDRECEPAGIGKESKTDRSSGGDSALPVAAPWRCPSLRAL